MGLSVIFWILLISLCVPAVQAAKCPQECFCVQLNVTCVNKNLTQVPATVDEITVKLDLRGNDIQELPTGAFMHIPNLTHLSLQHCNIHKVKEGAFRGLGRLVFLNLANNNIDILYQESFDGLSSLKQLIIEHNCVEEIQPGAFSQLGFLNLLSLSHNQLVYIPNMAFQGLQNIKRLRLSYNFLKYLNTEAFVGLVNLTSNPSLSPDAFKGLPKLTYLHLEKNRFTSFPKGVFKLVPSLRTLHLESNSITKLKPGIMTGAEGLRALYLTGNPIRCNCYLRPFREWAIHKKVKLMGTCGGLSHLSGKSLNAVHPSELRCQSQDEEAARIIPRPTEELNKVKCPANCVCEVDGES